MAERRIQLTVEADASRAQHGLRQVGQAAGEMAGAVGAAGNQAAQGVTTLNRAVGGTAQTVDRATRIMINSVQRTTAALEAGGRTSAQYYEMLARQRGVNINTLQPYLQQLQAVSARQQQAGQTAMGMSRQMAMVAPQLTDIVTSLASGQNAFTVFIQQGGQLRDLFGGAGAAARALGSYLISLSTPLNLSVAAIGAIAFAWHEGQGEAKAYERALILTGNAAGQSTDQLSAMAATLGRLDNVTRGAAAAAITELVSSGQVSGEVLQQVALAALQLERVGGQAVSETVKQFVELGREPVAASLRLNEQTNFLTAAVYQQVKALDDQGRSSDAAALAQQAYADALNGRIPALARNLGILESGWQQVKSAAAEAWDTMKRIGRDETLDEQIARVRNRLVTVRGAGNAASIVAGEEMLRLLNRKALAEQDAAQAQAKANDQEQARIRWLQDGEKYLSKRAQLERELGKTRSEATAAGVEAAELETRLAAIRRHYEDKGQLSGSYRAFIERQSGLQQQEEGQLKTHLARLDSERRRGLASDLQTLNAETAAKRTAIEQQIALARAKEIAAGRAGKTADVTEFRDEISQRQRELEALEEASGARRAELAKKADDLVLKIRADSLRAQGRLAEVAALEFQSQYGQAMADALRDGNGAVQAALADLRGQLVGAANFDEVRRQTDATFAEMEARLNSVRTAAANGGGMLEALGVADAESTIRQQYLPTLQALREQLQQLAAVSGNADQRKVAADVGKRLDGDAAAIEKAYADVAKNISKAWADMGKSIADGLTSAFGKGGKSIGGLVGALTQYQKARSDITVAESKQLELARQSGSVQTAQLARSNAMTESTRAQVAMYGDLAGAAKGYFKEGTKGYSQLQAAERAFRVVETAMAAQSALQKIGLIQTVTAAKVAGDTTQTASATAGATAEITATLAKGQAAAVSGVANQAGGDPYSAFVRMAAMAAIMAALGFAVAGGGGSTPNLSKQRQEAAGTGSVLGDATAKSESLAKSIEALEKYGSVGIGLESEMLRSLRNIEAAIGGLSSLVVRSGLQTGGAAALVDTTFQQDALGRLVDKASTGWAGRLAARLGDPLNTGILSSIAGRVGNLFGTKTSVTDNGIYAPGQTLGAILSGSFDAYSYATVERKKKRFGFTTGRSTSEELAGVPGEITHQFALVVQSLVTGTRAAADALGQGGEAFNQRLAGFAVDLGHISLKDLTGKQIEEQFQKIFGKLGDDLARYAIPGIAEFQRVGEGAFETLSRVTGEMQSTDVLLRRMGVSSQQAFGATGLASLKAREHLIGLAGGIDQLSSQLTDYQRAFFSDAERRAIGLNEMGEAFRQLGLAMPQSNRGFRDLVEGLVRSGALASDAGRTQYAQLLKLAGAFAELYPLEDALAESSQQAAKSVAQLRQEASQLRDELLGKFRNDLTLDEAKLQIRASGLQLDIGALMALPARDFNSFITSMLKGIDASTVSGQAAIQTFASVADALAVLRDSAAETAAAAVRAAQEAATSQRSLLDRHDPAGVVARAQADIGKTFTELGLAIPKTRQQLVALVGGLQSATPTGQRQLAALAALANAFDAVFSAQETAAQQAAEAAKKAADEQIQQLQRVHDSISSALNNLLGQSEQYATVTRDQARATLESALAIAKAGGSLANFAGLESALGVISKLDKGAFGSAADYQREFGQLANLLTQLERYTQAKAPTIAPISGTVAQLQRGEPPGAASQSAKLEQQADEIRGLRADLHAIGATLAINTRDTARLLTRWDGDGLPETRGKT